MTVDSTIGMVGPSLSSFSSWLIPIAIGLVLWVLLSLPAYVIERFLIQARAKLRAFAADETANQERKNSSASNSASVFDLFARTHRLRRVVANVPTIPKRVIERVAHPIKRLNETTRDAGQRMVEATEGLEATARVLKGIRHERGPSLSSVHLPADGSPEEFRKLRRAKAKLLVSSVLIAALVLVNTGMLSQVLKDVLEFGSRPIVGGLRLYHFLAFFATLAEAGLGYLMAASHPDDEPASERSYFMQGLLAVLTGGLAIVEGFFYSRIGAGSGGEVASLSVFGLKLEMQQAFFVMGFILPVTLAGLGHMWGRAFLLVRTGHAIDELRHLLDRARTRVDRLSSDVGKLNDAIGKVETRAKQVQSSVPQFSKEHEGALARIVNEATSELARLGESRKNAPVELLAVNEQEVHREALRAAIWFGLTLLAAVVLVWLGFVLLGVMYPGVSASLRIASALLYCIVLLACGLALRSEPLVLDEREGLRPVGNYRTLLGRAIAIASIALVLTFSVVAMTRQEQAGSTQGMWILVMAAGLSLVVLGRELPAILAVGAGLFRAAWRGTAVLLPRLMILLMRFAVVLLVVVEFIVGLIAAPVHWAMGLRRSTKQAA